MSQEPSAPTNVLSSSDIDIQPDDSLSGRVIDGRYRIGELLGAGGVGVVYAALHVEIKKQVAIKVLHGELAAREQFRLRFEREARASSKLSHPGCVSVIDFGRISRVEPTSTGAGPPDERAPDPLLGTPYLVMEFVRGQVLADRIAEGPITPTDAVAITRRLLAALRHAHGLGIVHRDVKPANIMLSKAGELEPWVKLLDFGLAKDLEDTDAQKPLTEVGMVFGTPGYLSPEQAAGQRADARSDLYSLGVVLFEMVCGRPPFMNTDRMQVVRDHLQMPPPRAKALAPLLSDTLDAVIAKALTKRPEDRYANAEDFASALAGCAEAAPTAPLPLPTGASGPTFAATPRAIERRGPGPSFANRVREVIAGLVAVVRLYPRIVLALGTGVALALLAVLLLTGRARAPVASAPPTQAASASGSALRHLGLADDYSKKLWCSDALDELSRAQRDDATIGRDPNAARVAMSCLRAKTQARAVRFLVDVVGAGALPGLKDIAANDNRAEFRAGAAKAAKELQELQDLARPAPR